MLLAKILLPAFIRYLFFEFYLRCWDFSSLFNAATPFPTAQGTCNPELYIPVSTYPTKLPTLPTLSRINHQSPTTKAPKSPTSPPANLSKWAFQFPAPTHSSSSASRQQRPRSCKRIHFSSSPCSSCWLAWGCWSVLHSSSIGGRIKFMRSRRR